MIFHAIQTFGRFFTKIKTSFGILFDKIQSSFQNTIFWYLIRALIHRNHFYDLKFLTEFKACSTTRWILILFDNLSWFFQKITITYNLGQSCWDIFCYNFVSWYILKIYFSAKASSPHKSIFFAKLLKTKRDQIDHW